MLADLSRRGQGRSPTETVRELEARLAARCPEVGGELAALSTLYERSRYSSDSTSAPDADRAEAAAARIVAALAADDPVLTAPVAPARSRAWGRTTH